MHQGQGNRMYSVKFDDRGEIRMGSPYHLAKPIITGDFVPDLSGYSFQDVSAVSSDGKDLYLVFWDLQDNSPAFRVFWLSEEKRCARTSERVPAACRELVSSDTRGLINARVWDLFHGERVVQIAFPE
jgi:hypothetical protein